MASAKRSTTLEKSSLEAHVDLCQLRYEQLDGRLTNLEEKVEEIHKDIQTGQQSMSKVIITSTGTIIAGLLSTIVVILLKFS